jgi:hypothetical protein
VVRMSTEGVLSMEAKRVGIEPKTFRACLSSYGDGLKRTGLLAQEHARLFKTVESLEEGMLPKFKVMTE